MAHPTEDTDHILEAAFNEAFSPPPSRRQSVQPPVKTSAPADPTIEPTPPLQEAGTAESSSLTDDGWKLEYEEQVKAWRVQSAEAREKAEKVREQWEAKRVAERDEATRRGTADISEEPEVIPGPRNVGKQSEPEAQQGKTVVEGLPSLVSGERHTHVAGSSRATLNRAESQPDTVDGSQKWEEVNSSTISSYPSMSFPEQTATPPFHHPHSPPSQATPPSVTLSVFDSSLSTRTRIKALASSLAINLLLPFVNGVMLGFGEIFAKNFVLGWLGWGATASTVGISQRRRFGQSGFR